MRHGICSEMAVREGSLEEAAFKQGVRHAEDGAARLRRPGRLATVPERPGPPACERGGETATRIRLPSHRLLVSFTHLPNEFLAFFSLIYRSFFYT